MNHDVGIDLRHGAYPWIDITANSDLQFCILTVVVAKIRGKYSTFHAGEEEVDRNVSAVGTIVTYLPFFH